MKDQRKTEIRVGVTVLLGIIIFLWILGWAKNFSLAPSENIIKVKFNNTSGLETGDPVTVNGVRKGFVEDFKVDGSGVIVTLQIDNNVHLQEDAEFAISMLDLMGGKKVDIAPGTSPEKMNYNKIQEGIFYADIPQVMSMVGSFRDDFTSTLSDVKITLNALNDYLTDKDLNRDIKSSMEGLSEITTKLNTLIDENRESLKQLTANTAGLTEEAKKFLEENKEKMNSSIDELQSLLKNTDDLMTKLNKFTDEMNAKQNNLGKLIYDEKMFNDLSKTLEQVNELTKLLLEQLKDDGIKIDANIF
jgi:phospholipid/cholesterol/gamma-HCH transport system substrate-binding protein